MDSKVIAALIGLGGISLGAFLAGVGYYLKSRNERLQTKKLVLFHLLEFRQLLKSSYSNPNEFSEKYISYCKSHFKKIGFSENEEIPEELTALIKEHMGNVLAAFRPKIDESFVSSFEESLKMLCKDDPILAFKLRGKEKLNEVLDAQENYINNFSNADFIKTSTLQNNAVSQQMNDFSNIATEELIKDIDKDISLVSKSCSIITWFNCRTITKNKSKPNICFKETGIDKALDTVFEQLIKSANNSSQQSTSNDTSA